MKFIIVLILDIALILCSIWLGIHWCADDLTSQGAIGTVKRDYLKSWEYFKGLLIKKWNEL